MGGSFSRSMSHFRPGRPGKIPGGEGPTHRARVLRRTVTRGKPGKTRACPQESQKQQPVPTISVKKFTLRPLWLRLKIVHSSSPTRCLALSKPLRAVQVPDYPKQSAMFVPQKQYAVCRRSETCPARRMQDNWNRDCATQKEATDCKPAGLSQIFSGGRPLNPVAAAHYGSGRASADASRLPPGS